MISWQYPVYHSDPTLKTLKLAAGGQLKLEILNLKLETKNKKEPSKMLDGSFLFLMFVIEMVDRQI